MNGIMGIHSLRSTNNRNGGKIMKYLMGLIIGGIIAVGLFTGVQAVRVAQECDARQSQMATMLDEVGKVR
jgi:hypothetical protein